MTKKLVLSYYATDIARNGSPALYGALIENIETNNREYVRIVHWSNLEDILRGLGYGYLDIITINNSHLNFPRRKFKNWFQTYVNDEKSLELILDMLANPES